MGLFDVTPGPFANPGAHGIRNPDKPQFPGGHPTRPAYPDHPGLGHGHGTREPVYDFLGNQALRGAGVGPNLGRWGN
jgi:hypothetical protein